MPELTTSQSGMSLNRITLSNGETRRIDCQPFRSFYIYNIGNSALYANLMSISLGSNYAPMTLYPRMGVTLDYLIDHFWVKNLIPANGVTLDYVTGQGQIIDNRIDTVPVQYIGRASGEVTVTGASTKICNSDAYGRIIKLRNNGPDVIRWGGIQSIAGNLMTLAVGEREELQTNQAVYAYAVSGITSTVSYYTLGYIP